MGVLVMCVIGLDIIDLFVVYYDLNWGKWILYFDFNKFEDKE